MFPLCIFIKNDKIAILNGRVLYKDNTMINQNLKERVVLGFCLTVALLTLGMVIYVSKQWHQDWVITHRHIETPSTPVSKNESSEMIASLSNAHLFGKAVAKLSAVPITNLEFRVAGIVKAAAKASSKAYISVSGQVGKIYQIGDSLPYGVKVYDITGNAVILENNGHLEKLVLPREQLKFKQSMIEERG